MRFGLDAETLDFAWRRRPLGEFAAHLVHERLRGVSFAAGQRRRQPAALGHERRDGVGRQHRLDVQHQREIIEGRLACRIEGHERIDRAALRIVDLERRIVEPRVPILRHHREGEQFGHRLIGHHQLPQTLLVDHVAGE